MGLLFASLRIYDLKTWWHWSTVLFSAIRNEKGFFIHFLWLSAWRRTCLLFDFLLFSVILPQFDRPFLTSQVWAAWLVHIIVLVHYKIYKGTLTKATLAWFCRNMNLKRRQRYHCNYCLWLLHENKPHQIYCKAFVGARQVALFSATWLPVWVCYVMKRWSSAVTLKLLSLTEIAKINVYSALSDNLNCFFKHCWLWIKHMTVDNLDEVAGVDFFTCCRSSTDLRCISWRMKASWTLLHWRCPLV